MRIIQSFWTKPSRYLKSINQDHRVHGGWPNAKFHYMSWALSCLKLLEFYPQVELYTDSYGKEILIEKLGLPYTHVKVPLNDLDEYNPSLWTLGKLYTYSLQKAPFIHIDGDVFIWKRFDESVEQAGIFAQNIEVNDAYYGPVINSMLAQGFSLSEDMKREILSEQELCVSNTGVVGGTNIEFLTKYAQFAIDLINSNLDKIDKVDGGAFSVFAEQYFIYKLAELENMPIYYLYNYIIDYINNSILVNFHLVPQKIHYIHPIAKYKRNVSICNTMAARLRIEYPTYYYRVNHLFNCRELD